MSGIHQRQHQAQRKERQQLEHREVVQSVSVVSKTVNR
jgi:hypothetical protein